MTERSDPDPRLQQGYKPEFDIDSDLGKKGEAKVHFLQASSAEVKTDQRALSTGNLYIEFECRGKPSGLATTAAEFWWFVLGGQGSQPGGVVLAVETEQLKSLVIGCGIASETDGKYPTRGYLLPLRKIFRNINVVASPEKAAELIPAVARRRPTAICDPFKPNPELERWLNGRSKV